MGDAPQSALNLGRPSPAVADRHRSLWVALEPTRVLNKPVLERYVGPLPTGGLDEPWVVVGDAGMARTNRACGLHRWSRAGLRFSSSRRYEHRPSEFVKGTLHAPGEHL